MKRVNQHRYYGMKTCYASNTSGFTLLETLIALAVLAIGMLGIYTLLGQAINVKTYSNDKLAVIEKGYERLLQTINFPNGTYKDQVTEEGEVYRFSETTEPTILPGISEKYLKITSNNSGVEFIYYEVK